MLATVAVTFGLVVVLAQHMSETYARRISVLLGGRSVWRSAVIGEALAVVATVAIALWRPDLTCGAAASILLVASLLESWFAVTKLLRQFDPVNLIQALQDQALLLMRREKARSGSAIQFSQAILNLLLQGAGKGDVEVVTAGVAGWNAILGGYLDGASLVWSDPYVYWLFPRCEELIERYAGESVGLLLPEVVTGVAALGRTTATYRNPLNAAVDEGTAFFTQALTTAARAASTAVRSPAAGAAVQGIGSIGMACVGASKFTTLQGPIKSLTVIGEVTSSTASHIAGRVTVELATLLVALARSDSSDVMRPAVAESAVDGLCEVVKASGGASDPTHVLTAPLAEMNLPLICQTLARAGGNEPNNYRRGKWDRMALAVAELGLRAMTDTSQDVMMHMNTVDTVACSALGILAGGHVEPYLGVLDRMSKSLLQSVRGDGGIEAQLVAFVFLAIYCASDPPQPGALRDTALEAARVLGEADDRDRLQLAPLARQLGATAIHRGDPAMAQLMAAASMPEPPTGSKQIRDGREKFAFAGGFDLPAYVGRPGLDLPEIPRDYLSADAQREFLALERAAYNLPPQA
jgi:hypothetical protein